MFVVYTTLFTANTSTLQVHFILIHINLLIELRSIQFRWVWASAGNFYNEVCNAAQEFWLLFTAKSNHITLDWYENSMAM